MRYKYLSCQSENHRWKIKSSKSKLWFEMKSTKLYSKMLLVKSSENNFIFLPAFYLIMCLMNAPKNFEKIAILKTQELDSFWGVKTHFGKLALKWCSFRHEIKMLNFWQNSHFDNMRADFFRKCQNSLRQISPKIMNFQAWKKYCLS